ncbi:MBL fold metallo-hydrolase [Desulfonatronovibrio magnus]|uniref:MBL fold metallo-hydrolase n=1 Tax=Desulfonatronovibrio magnus TaxID=698827 RepID=UPI0018DCB09F|nr:MBL fold metallo-hydrolase [Desulfonatronovibrio magnus]
MIEIRKFCLGALETNCYLLHNKAEAIAIDPGGDPLSLVAYLHENGLKLVHILNTHLHFDHIQGNAALVSETNAPVSAPEKDRYLLDTEVGGGGFMGFPKTPSFSFQDLQEGDKEFLGVNCRILWTPGHTPGSVSFYFPDVDAVFVGDLIFYRSVGRTDFPGGNAQTLKESASNKIFTLPDNTVIYSGHGPESRVLDEKLHNPFFHESKII